MKTLSRAGKRVPVVFTAMIAVFFFLVNAGIVMASPAPLEGASVPEGKGEVQYLVWHHPTQCINFIGPTSRTVCVNDSALSYPKEHAPIFSQIFCNMLTLQHDNALIPLTSWLWVKSSKGPQGTSVALSDGYNDPYAEGQGNTFPEAMENLFYNFFHRHGEKKALSKTGE